MITKVLDFKNIHSNKDLGLYISKELKFSYIMDGIHSWDAYIDLFSEIIYKEFTGDYKKEDGWDDYDDYLDYLEMEKKLDLKMKRV